MRRAWRGRALIAIAAVLLISASAARASITDCGAFLVSCTYLPMMIKPLPSPTPRPSATPTPTPTPLPAGVQILPGHSAFVDSGNYLHVVGEVYNNTPSTIQFVKIIADVYNGSQLVGADYTYIYLDSLPPNTKTCFDVFMQSPAAWTSYQFEAPNYSTGGGALPNIALINTSGHVDPSTHWYDIVGQARNDQGRRVEYVEPVATLYAGATVVGCDFTFVNSTHLDPGQTSSFSFTITGRNYNDVTAFRLQADGNIQ